MKNLITVLALSAASLLLIGCPDEGGGNKNRTTVGTAAQCATAQYDQRTNSYIDRNGRRINCYNRGNNFCNDNYNRSIHNGQHTNINNHLCNQFGNNIWGLNGGQCGPNAYPVQIGMGTYCANTNFFSPFGMTPYRGITYRFYYPNPYYSHAGYYWGVWHNGHYRFSDDGDNSLGWALGGALVGAALGYAIAQ